MAVYSGYEGRGGSRPVSRVLSTLAGRTIIHLGPASPPASSDLPGPGAGRAIGSLFGLAPGGVCPAAPVARDAVRSYRTISPLPVPVARPSAVYFLWHFPSARAAQALPGALPCGARTFLRPVERRSSGRLPPDRKIRPNAYDRNCYSGFRAQCFGFRGSAGVWFLAFRLWRPVSPYLLLAAPAHPRQSLLHCSTFARPWARTPAALVRPCTFPWSRPVSLTLCHLPLSP